MKQLVPVLAAIGGIAIAVLGYVFLHVVLPTFAAKNLAKSEDGLKRIAAEASKNLPKMVDSETRLDRVTASGHMLVYEYDMPNYSASQMDLRVFHDALLPSVRSKSCTLEEARKMFLDNGVTLRYHYVDKARAEMDTIDITLADCKSVGL